MEDGLVQRMGTSPFNSPLYNITVYKTEFIFTTMYTENGIFHAVEIYVG